MPTDTVYLLKQNNDRILVGKIVENKIDLKLNTHITDVNYFNYKMLDFIKKDIKEDKFSENSDIIGKIQAGDITGYVVGIMKWRRCRGYLVIQKSNINVRFLAYLADHIFNPAVCFGTSSGFVEKKEVIQEFKEIIQKLKNQKDNQVLRLIENVKDSQFFLP